MRDIFGLTMVKKKEADEFVTMRTQFHIFLSSIPHILAITGNEIKKDEVETGDVIYEIGTDTFHFNLFPWKFTGFYINDGLVTFYTFIDEALLRRVTITENDIDRYQVTEFEKEVLGVVDADPPEDEEDDEEHEEKIYP